MNAYDPEESLDGFQWLSLDENTRLELVSAYHDRAHIISPNARLHAALHVVVENQLAMGTSAVRETVARLQAKGLTRHEALHRIGEVVTELVLEAARGGRTERDTSSRSYEQRLAALLAEE